MKTQSELDDLIRQWKTDPCWDIEDTEGYEEYRDYLLSVRLEYERQYQENEKARLKSIANTLQCSIAVVKRIEALEYRIKELENRQ